MNWCKCWLQRTLEILISWRIRYKALELIRKQTGYHSFLPELFSQYIVNQPTFTRPGSKCEKRHILESSVFFHCSNSNNTTLIVLFLKRPMYSCSDTDKASIQLGDKDLWKHVTTFAISLLLDSAFAKVRLIATFHFFCHLSNFQSTAYDNERSSYV